jgi:hypothetical protein
VFELEWEMNLRAAEGAKRAAPLLLLGGPAVALVEYVAAAAAACETEGMRAAAAAAAGEAAGAENADVAVVPASCMRVLTTSAVDNNIQGICDGEASTSVGYFCIKLVTSIG